MEKAVSINLNINSPEEMDIDTLSQTLARKLKDLAFQADAKGLEMSEEEREQYNKMRRALDLRIYADDNSERYIKVIKAILRLLKDNEVTVDKASDIFHDAYSLLLHKAKL